MEQSPTEKAIAMAQRMEALESQIEWLSNELNDTRQKHQHEVDKHNAYVAGIEMTLKALLNRSINL